MELCYWECTLSKGISLWTAKTGKTPGAPCKENSVYKAVQKKGYKSRNLLIDLLQYWSSSLNNGSVEVWKILFSKINAVSLQTYIPSNTVHQETSKPVFYGTYFHYKLVVFFFNMKYLQNIIYWPLWPNSVLFLEEFANLLWQHNWQPLSV